MEDIPAGGSAPRKVEEEEKLKLYEGELTRYVVGACLVAGMAGILFGYDIGISGGVTSMGPFLRKFFPKVYAKQAANKSRNQYCKFDDVGLTMFTSSLYLAALASSLVASWVTKELGRKFSMVVGGFIFFVGAALNAFAVGLWMLILGRLLLGIGVGFSVQVLVAGFIGWKFGVTGDVSVLPKWYAVLIVTFICGYVSGFAWSWGPLGVVLSAEIFPLGIRSAAQSIAISTSMLFTFLIAQLFLSMLCHMKFGLFLFFAFFLAATCLFVYLFLPETKNVPIESVHRVWEKHWFWKRFVLKGSAAVDGRFY
ncbi:Sugar transport protein 12 [Linum grandiflorum]